MQTFKTDVMANKGWDPDWFNHFWLSIEHG